MRAFKGGDRYAQLMMGQVDNLPDETLKNIAAFYADKALQEGDPGTADLALGEKIYRDGLLDKGVPACSAPFPSRPGQRSRGLPGGLRAERGLRG